MDDDVSVVSAASEFSSGIHDHGLRHVHVKIINGPDFGFDGLVRIQQLQPRATTVLEFILSALGMHYNNFGSRCIAGSFALKTYEERILHRDVAWPANDIDVFHVASTDLTDFSWNSVYPFLNWFHVCGYKIVLYDTTYPNGTHVTPATLMGYIASPESLGDAYPSLRLRAVVDVDVTSITNEIHKVSLLLHNHARTTKEIVKAFDIDICRVRMTWNLDDGYHFHSNPRMTRHIIAKKMNVYYRIFHRYDSETTRDTNVRVTKYMQRGYSVHRTKRKVCF